MLERVRRKGNPPILLVGMPILLVGMSTGAAPIENSMEVPRKLKRITISSSNPDVFTLSSSRKPNCIALCMIWFYTKVKSHKDSM